MQIIIDLVSKILVFVKSVIGSIKTIRKIKNSRFWVKTTI